MLSAFSPRRPNERRIFFPWEGRGGLWRFFQMGRFLPGLLLILVVAFASWVVARERRAAGVRMTLVALREIRPAVERYLLENNDACPADLREVLPFTSPVKTDLPRDGWGRPVRLVCPSFRDGVKYVLMSDGPDGKAGGLDRIEY